MTATPYFKAIVISIYHSFEIRRNRSSSLPFLKIRITREGRVPQENCRRLRVVQRMSIKGQEKNSTINN